MTKESVRDTSMTMTLPMLPMRDIVVFPQMTAPFFIGRAQSVESLEQALQHNRQVFVVTQSEPTEEDPEEKHLYRMGAVGQIMQIMRLQNGTIKALFEAQHRAVLNSADLQGDFYTANVTLIEEVQDFSPKLVALSKNVRGELKRYLKEVKQHSDGIEKLAIGHESPAGLADRIAPILSINIHKKQKLLETLDPWKRLQSVYQHMFEEMEVKKVEQKLKERVQGQIGKTQKEYYLNEQAKAIQKELGQGEDGKAEIEEYERKLDDIEMSEEARDMATKELNKLKMMQPMSAEANVVRNYLDWILSMPWDISTEDRFDLEHAEGLLNQEHHGLEKVKDRIIEYLAVAQQVGALRGPIICLVGPPGVGKTSLARSVAKAVEKNFVRISLGGVRDEAEVRGHRRTYVGALPGKIIQSLKKAKSNNPLILLDEIDKMSQSAMGDPAAALLEVLDPEQNHSFMDHYLEVEFDLSEVLFFCTANVLQDIPPALRDRMEMITLPGYTELEKHQISAKHLIPKQVEENGLSEENIQFQNKGIDEIIQRYTREAGVRSLERAIAKVCRKVATHVVRKDDKKTIQINPKRVHDYLGVPKYKHKFADGHNEIGITSGLAWTQVGGELLQTEVSLMKGTGRLQLTGQLGDVMKESAKASLSYVRANANRLGILSSVFQTTDIHIHVPEGAVPKDGPSAGVTMTTSLVSAFTQTPVMKDVAMTGEITLRGRVLPIGGLKEKLIAAKRGNISKVLVPKANEKDLVDVPKEITRSLEIVPVSHADEVLKHALESLPEVVMDPPETEATTGNTPIEGGELLSENLFVPNGPESVYPTPQQN